MGLGEGYEVKRITSQTIQLQPRSTPSEVRNEDPSLPCKRPLEPGDPRWEHWLYIYERGDIKVTANLKGTTAPAGLPLNLQFTLKEFHDELFEQLKKFFDNEHLPLFGVIESCASFVMTKGWGRHPSDICGMIVTPNHYDHVLEACRRTILAFLAKQGFVTHDLKIAQLFERSDAVTMNDSGLLYHIGGMKIQICDLFKSRKLSRNDGWIIIVNKDNTIEVCCFDGNQPITTVEEFDKAVGQTYRNEAHVRDSMIFKTRDAVLELVDLATKGALIMRYQFKAALLNTPRLLSTDPQKYNAKFLDDNFYDSDLGKLLYLLNMLTFTQEVRISEKHRERLQLGFLREGSLHPQNVPIFNLSQLGESSDSSDIAKHLLMLVNASLVLTWMNQEGQRDNERRGGHLRAYEFTFGKQTSLRNMILINYVNPQNGEEEEYALHFPHRSTPLELIQDLIHHWHAIETSIKMCGGFELLEPMWEVLGVDSSWMTFAGVQAMLETIPTLLERPHVAELFNRWFYFTTSSVMKELRLDAHEESTRAAMDLFIAKDHMVKDEERLRGCKANELADVYKKVLKILSYSTERPNGEDLDELLELILTIFSQDNTDVHGLRARTAKTLGVLTKTLLPYALDLPFLSKRFTALVQVINLLGEEQGITENQQTELVRKCLKVMKQGIAPDVQCLLFTMAANRGLIRDPQEIIKAAMMLTDSKNEESLIACGILLNRLFKNQKILPANTARCCALLIRQLKDMNQPVLNQQVFLLLRRMRRRCPEFYAQFIAERSKDILEPVLQALALIVDTLEVDSDILEACEILTALKKQVNSPRDSSLFKKVLFEIVHYHGGLTSFSNCRLLGILVSEVLTEGSEWLDTVTPALFVMTLRLLRHVPKIGFPLLKKTVAMSNTEQKEKLFKKLLEQQATYLHRKRRIASQTPKFWQQGVDALEELRMENIDYTLWRSVISINSRREALKLFISLVQNVNPKLLTEVSNIELLNQEVQKINEEKKEVRIDPLASSHDQSADFKDLPSIIEQCTAKIGNPRKPMRSGMSRRGEYIIKTLRRDDLRPHKEKFSLLLKQLVERLCAHTGRRAMALAEQIVSLAAQANVFSEEQIKQFIPHFVTGYVAQIKSRAGNHAMLQVMRHLHACEGLPLSETMPLYLQVLDVTLKKNHQSAQTLILTLLPRIEQPTDFDQIASRVCILIKIYLAKRTPEDRTLALKLFIALMACHRQLRRPAAATVDQRAWSPEMEQLLLRMIPFLTLNDVSTTQLLRTFLAELYPHLKMPLLSISSGTIDALVGRCLRTNNKFLAIACAGPYQIERLGFKEAAKYLADLLTTALHLRDIIITIADLIPERNDTRLNLISIYSRASNARCLQTATNLMRKSLVSLRTPDYLRLFRSLQSLPIEDYTDPLITSVEGLLWDNYPKSYPLSQSQIDLLMDKSYVQASYNLLLHWMTNQKACLQRLKAFELLPQTINRLTALNLDKPPSFFLSELNRLLDLVANGSELTKKVLDMSFWPEYKPMKQYIESFLQPPTKSEIATRIQELPQVFRLGSVFLWEFSFSAMNVIAIELFNDKELKNEFFIRFYELHQCAMRMRAYPNDMLGCSFGMALHLAGIGLHCSKDIPLDVLLNILGMLYRSTFEITDGMLISKPWYDYIAIMYTRLSVPVLNSAETISAFCKLHKDILDEGKQSASKESVWHDLRTRIFIPAVKQFEVHVHRQYLLLAELNNMLRKQPAGGTWKQRWILLLEDPATRKHLVKLELLRSFKDPEQYISSFFHLVRQYSENDVERFCDISILKILGELTETNNSMVASLEGKSLIQLEHNDILLKWMSNKIKYGSVDDTATKFKLQKAKLRDKRIGGNRTVVLAANSQSPIVYDDEANKSAGAGAGPAAAAAGPAAAPLEKKKRKKRK